MHIEICFDTEFQLITCDALSFDDENYSMVAAGVIVFVHNTSSHVPNQYGCLSEAYLEDQEVQTYPRSRSLYELLEIQRCLICNAKLHASLQILAQAYHVPVIVFQLVNRFRLEFGLQSFLHSNNACTSMYIYILDLYLINGGVVADKTYLSVYNFNHPSVCYEKCYNYLKCSILLPLEINTYRYHYDDQFYLYHHNFIAC